MLQRLPNALLMSNLEALCERLFAGPFAFCAGTLRFQPAPEDRPSRDLVQPATFAGVVDRFALAHPGADRAAVVSFWSQIYFSRLVIPVTVLCVAADRPLPLDFGTLRVRFCPERGTPLSFHVADDAPPRPGPALLHAFYEQEVAATVAMLKRHSGLAARLFWENAGSYGIWALGELARNHPPAQPESEALLRDETWPRAACSTMRHLKAGALAARPVKRRVCCLRYGLPAVGRCPDICPLAADGAATISE